jgi:muramoyltetrapeptide carboxypeptidase
MHFKSLFYVLLFMSCTYSKSSKITFKTPQTMASKKYIRPAKLQVGDTIAIVAPAGILKSKKKTIEAAQMLLKNWGLVPVLGPHLFSESYHFAGTDAQRLKDLQWALDKPDVKAIWCARGGYGSMRIMDGLNFETFKKNPKWMVGYSDVTALHNQLQNLGYETLHAMMPVNMEEDAKAITASITSLKAGLFGTLEKHSIEPNKSNRMGSAKGILTGGNLTLLTAQLGSASQLDTRNKILFIEEIGEYKYHIDRMLQSLKRAGYFNHCNGIIVGDMMDIKANSPAWGTGIEELIMNILDPYDFPVAFGIPAGHMHENRALIFGRSIDLNITKSETVIHF